MDALGRLNADSALIRARVETLSRQVASGRRAEVMGDIAPDAPRAINLSNDISRRETYTTAIDQALGRTGVVQATLQRLKDIASEFRSNVAMRLDAANPAALATVQARARSAALEVGTLLNTRFNGEYLFGGSDLSKPPVPDAGNLLNSPLAMAIGGQIAGRTAGNAAAVAAATRAAAQDQTPGASPFSAFLEDPAAGGAEPRRGAPAADGLLVAYGIAANRNGTASSQGETTGSWARDLLRGLLSLAALGPAQTAQPLGFEALAGTLRAGMESAENALSEEMGALGSVEQQLGAARTRHRGIADTLRSQLSDITDVDLASTLTRLQAMRNALEASYRMTSSMGSLTLSQFLR